MCTVCAGEEPAPPGGEGLREVFPHVRIDAGAGVIELEGEVPIDINVPQSPEVYIEQVACIPDTKEHEVLVVTGARPSHVHAALLLLGLEPGAPAKWIAGEEGDRVTPPSGPAVRVELVVEDEDGGERSFHPSDWLVHAETKRHPPRHDWVFAGSVMFNRDGLEEYDADLSGTLIGLASFGTEVLAWPEVFSPDSGVDEPVWIADVETVPPIGTGVTIRLTAIGDGR